MALTKPATVPKIDDNQTNRTAPPASKQTDGYALNEILPAAEYNHEQGFTGDWLAWLNERHDDGGSPADYETHPDDPATGAGGDGTFRGSDVSDGSPGGAATFRGGEGKPGGGAAGGAATFRGGDSGVFNGDGGDATFRAGDAPGFGNGGDAELRGGNSRGTNLTGGTLNSGGGESTGSQGSTANLRAAVGGASGSGVNAAEIFLAASGPQEKLRAFKPIDGITNVVDTDAVTGTGNGTGSGLRGVGGATGHGIVAEADLTGTPVKTSLRVVPQEIIASSPFAGDVMSLEAASTSHSKLVHYNGAEFERLVPQVFSAISESDQLTNFTADVFAQTYTIPGDSLRVGSVIRINLSGSRVSSAPSETFSVQLRIGSTLIVSTTTEIMDDVSSFVIAATITMIDPDATARAHIAAEGYLTNASGDRLSALSSHRVDASFGDFTADQDIAINAISSLAVVGNTIQLRTFVVDIT